MPKMTLEELKGAGTHTCWFAGSTATRAWSIQPRPDAGSAPEPTPRDLQWLAELNNDQNEREVLLAELAYAQQRAWTLTNSGTRPPQIARTGYLRQQPPEPAETPPEP